jgi:uncharacterized glyoxalase superfamily protein PhnB
MKLYVLFAGLAILHIPCFSQEKTVNMIPKITFITLGVSDLERSVDFYENQFGWTRSPMSTGDIVFFSLDGIQLAIYPHDELAKDATVSPDGSGFKSFTFSVNLNSEAEVDNLIDKLRQNGVTIIKEPQKVFWGGYSSYIADPDGFLWEIAWNPFMETE